MKLDTKGFSRSPSTEFQKVLKAEMKIRFFFGEITFIAQYNLP